MSGAIDWSTPVSGEVLQEVARARKNNRHLLMFAPRQRDGSD
jgi:hypothetical protein